MRVASYVQPQRTVGSVTGVGKHIGHIPVELANRASMTLVTAKQSVPAESPLARLPATTIPWPARWIEWSWTLANAPRIERWIAPVDWVYCPAETPVATRARQAITAHSSDWAEPDVPWANEPRYRRLRWRWHLVHRAVKRRRAIVLAVSEFLKRRLVELVGLDEKLIHVVGNGVDDAYFRATPTLTDRPHVVAVGGLTTYKGGDRLIEVARRLPEVRFISVGSDQPELAKVAGSNIERCGYVGVGDGLPGLMAGAVAVLHLSRYETFGIPVAEAMAAGAPVIVANETALPEIVGDAGIVVDADFPDPIAEHIRTLIHHPSEHHDYVERGRQRAAAYHWSAVADRVWEVLNQS